MRNEGKIPKLLVVWMIFCFSLLGVGIYVLAHFVQKYW